MDGVMAWGMYASGRHLTGPPPREDTQARARVYVCGIDGSVGRHNDNELLTAVAKNSGGRVLKQPSEWGHPPPVPNKTPPGGTKAGTSHR